MASSDPQDVGFIHSGPALRETLFDRCCKFLSCAAIVLMLLVIITDIFTRTLFHFSFEVSDEISGYCLVAVTFLSLSVCQANNSFHQMELVQAKLRPLAKAVSRVIFGSLMIGACFILLWQFFRLEMSSWRSGAVAPTILRTPLWLPQLVMLVGAFALLVSVLRTFMADVRSAQKLLSGGSR